MKIVELVENGTAYTVWIGTSAADNWQMIQSAEPDDIWFHLEGVPSCHIILKKEFARLNDESSDTLTVKRFHADAEPDDAILYACAALCKKHTAKYRILMNRDCPPVQCTRVSNIRLGKTVGSVYIKDSRCLCKLRVK